MTGARGVVIGIPTLDDGATAQGVAEAVGDLRGVLVAAGGAGVAHADLPASVLRLPNRIVDSAVALDQQLAAVSR